MDYKKYPKYPFQFVCENCSFYSANKKDYTRHITTRKHKMITNNYNLGKIPESYPCVCGKEYKHRQGLYAHKKKCSQLKEDNTYHETKETPPNNALVTVLLEQNTMFQELILKNEEDKKELLRINQEEKKELLRRNEEQRNQMMDLQHQFLEAIQKGNTV